MSNVAYADFGNQRRQERSTVANLEDGYTRIANDLFEAVMCADLTARQLKVVMAIIRKTYGFGKKLDRITNTQIAEMTGIHHTHVCKAKNEMIAMNIVISSGNKIGINKDFTEWNFNISQVSETLAKSANKTLAKTANSHKPSQLNTKETITKEKKDNATHTLQWGEADNLIFRDELIKLLQGKFNCSTAKELHNAVEAEILKSGYLCQREYTVADRGDGRKGKIDLYVTNANGAICGIELDQKSPREKSIFKLQQLPAGIVMLRETSINEVYEVGGISVVNANEGEIDKKPAGYYQEYLDAYNEEVGDRLPHARGVNSERKRKFKKLIEKLATPNVDGWRAYVRAFVRMAKPFYFGDNDSGWVADIDHLLKEKTLTAVKEGKPSLTGVYQ